MKNKAAQALARMAAGKPKRFSAAEIARRTARIQKYNAERKKVAAGAKTSCPAVAWKKIFRASILCS